jgi:hypothetical protein
MRSTTCSISFVAYKSREVVYQDLAWIQLNAFFDLPKSLMIRLSYGLTTRRKYAMGFSVAGFAIAEVLCAYAFYLTSHHQIGNYALFLILCPPSIGAMALDNAGIVGGLIGWFLISLENAVIYGLIGLGAGSILQRKLR